MILKHFNLKSVSVMFFSVKSFHQIISLSWTFLLKYLLSGIYNLEAIQHHSVKVVQWGTHKRLGICVSYFLSFPFAFLSLEKLPHTLLQCSVPEGDLHCQCILWQYGLWSFQTGGTKSERFLPKNQHTQSKLLNFENWVNGEVSKIGHHFRK